jgi:HD-GYP domain-containing protein (c-di-GMP phosphodiesterase class II)
MPGLRQAEIIMALSLATDLGTGRPMEWAMRSALLGIRLGEVLGLSDEELHAVYHCALLLYVGCTSEIGLGLQIFGEDPAAGMASVDLIDKADSRQMMAWMLKHWGAGQSPLRRLRSFASAGTIMSEFQSGHCEVARLFAERLGFEQRIQDALGQMYERWDGKGEPHHLQGEAIALPIRIVILVRDIEAYLNTHGVDSAVAVVRQRAGSFHDPYIASRFCALAPQLCATLEQDANWERLLAVEPLPRFYTEEEFDDTALVLADFIDLISPYLAGHSRSVAALVEAAAKEYRLPETDVRTVWRSALMHDLGKVAIPHGLWSRPNPLSSSEWERVRLHPYYTERILARPAALAQIGAIAACHHERLDGSGYHRSVRADMLPPAARLLAAANFYQARIETRPNREALALDAAAQTMRKEVREGRLDGEVVNCVLKAAGHPLPPVRRERIAGLSEREIEVLRLIVRGLSNRQMAQQLSVSEKTIGTHIMHIYEKIGCSTRSGATLFAMQHNLITP